MDAIILAGGIPGPDEPLYPFTRGQPKALLEVAGKPMVQWVLDALSGSDSIQNIVIVGLTAQAGLYCKKHLLFVPNQSGFVENIRAAAQKIRSTNPSARHVLLVSSDIPTIKAGMVEWIIKAAGEPDRDVFYNIVARETMEKRFPNAHRTYLHFKDLTFCSSDLHVVSLRILLEEDIALWKKITDARKSPLKQAWLIGLDTVFLFMFRLITVKQAETRIMRKFKISGRVVLCPHAETGMDVDKPRHLEILESDLKRRF